MIGTQAYQCGDDLHNRQAVLRPCLLLARDSQLQAGSAASSHSLLLCQSGCSLSRHIADGWDIVVLRLTPAVHGVFRDGFKARVYSADGRRWHRYKSHGATELSLAKSPKVRQS